MKIKVKKLPYKLAKDTLKFGKLYKDAINSYNKQAYIIEKLVTNLFKAERTHLLIIYGPPGIGKTHIVKEVIKKLKINFKYINAKETKTKLYKNAYDFRNKNDLIVLDDCDSVFDDSDQMNILKNMTDSYKVRKVTYDSTAWQLKDIPESFNYKGKVIILTNREVENNPDYDALLSRSYPTTMEINNFQKVCKSMDILLTDENYNTSIKFKNRVDKVCKYIWENIKYFEKDKYTLRTSWRLYNTMLMLDDDVDLFSTEIKKIKDFKIN